MLLLLLYCTHTNIHTVSDDLLFQPQLLMASLAALPLKARRLLPETILALLQYRERQDVHLSPAAEDASLPGHACASSPMAASCAHLHDPPLSAF